MDRNPLHETIRNTGERPMKYTAGQAAKAAGVATATVTRAIKSGKISGQKDASGAWEIDASELHRVFPIVATKGPTSASMQDRATHHETPEIPPKNSGLEREVQVLREALADTREDRDRWRDMAERLALSPPSPTVLPSSPVGFWRRLFGA
jgi:DNA-binding MurR/RpiR family transcriptional regulator